MFCLSLFSRIIQTNTKATWKSWVVLHFLFFLLFLLFFAFLCARAGTRTQDLALASHLLIHLPGFTEDGKNQMRIGKAFKFCFMLLILFNVVQWTSKEIFNEHEHQLSCLLPSVRSPQLGGMWALIFLEYMNSDVFVLSNKTLGTFFNQNYCKLYQIKIETNLDSTWIKVQHKSNKQQQKYYLMLISKFYQVHIRQLVP